jgi:serine/threonine protein kinase
VHLFVIIVVIVTWFSLSLSSQCCQHESTNHPLPALPNKIYIKKHIINHVKVVASGRSEEYYIFNEREIMIEINSDFHIKLINTYKSSKNLYILMEYAAGRNLKDQIERGKGLSDPSHVGAMTRVKFYAANLVLAMEHLHRKEITHRDLKPGNILIDNQGYLKVLRHTHTYIYVYI